MTINQIDDALVQVRRVQELVMLRRRFQGYSGVARMLSGTVAFAGAAVLASSRMPHTPTAHLVGWGVVLVLGVLFNYSALTYWFLFSSRAHRDPNMLKPAVDALPALGTGAFLSVALIVHAQYDLLFGTWMCLYGLAQVAYRQSLPIGIYGVGVAYLLCGAYCLVSPLVHFCDPWSMGIVFFAGEWAGGIILCLNKQRQSPTQNQPSPEDADDDTTESI